MKISQKRIENVSEKLSYELRFKKLANAIHSAPNFNTVLIGLREQILNLYEAEMGTIYLVDPSNSEIYSWTVLPGTQSSVREIRIPINSKSCAGYVAQTGKIVNIKNVYDEMELMNIDPDLAFDSSWDKKSGIKTKQVLAVPILFRNALLGVIQLINKKHGRKFTVEDQKYLFDLTETLGIAFNNLHKLSKKTPTKFDQLIKKGIISEKEIANAQTIARQQKRDVENVLLKDFKVSKNDLGNALARFYNVGFEDFRSAQYDPSELVRGINIEYFRKSHCFPLAKKDGRILLAIDDPHDQVKIQEIIQVLRTTQLDFRVALTEDIEEYIKQFKASKKIKVNHVPEKSLNDILDEMKEQEIPAEVSVEEIGAESVDEKSIVLLVRKIIEDAYKENASDIHIEPYGMKQDAEVRFRIDGRCTKVLTIPKNHIKAVVSRFKILSHLDISERRKPQDGKIKFRTSRGKEIELRVSTIPTADGNEDVVLRILADSEPLPLKKIMPESICKRFVEIIQKPYGIVLVVGPTGSGKTTTLHSALGYINTPDKKIWTAEDPVEITQFRLRQLQVLPKIGLTFASAMRAFLRADPDVIMVGEMRDSETVSMGIEASLTGHLVFSTLHTNSAPETIIRLVDMGMDPFNFADALLGILAQRLVRTLCNKCKTAYHPKEGEYTHIRKVYGPLFDKKLKIPYSKSLKLYKAKGCSECSNTGYKGRLGLFELLVGTDTIKKLVINRATVKEIKEESINEGMTTLLQEGINAVFRGHTDFKQVMSVCGQ